MTNESQKITKISHLKEFNFLIGVQFRRRLFAGFVVDLLFPQAPTQTHPTVSRLDSIS